jgi:hypothetical protein
MTETTKLAEYIDGSEDLLLQVIRTHQQNANASLRCTAHKHERNMKGNWKRKRMRTQFPRSLDDILVDMEQTYRWLKFGDIKWETESLIVAAQDQAPGTNYSYFKRKVLKEETPCL